MKIFRALFSAISLASVAILGLYFFLFASQSLEWDCRKYDFDTCASATYNGIVAAVILFFIIIILLINILVYYWLKKKKEKNVPGDSITNQVN